MRMRREGVLKSMTVSALAALMVGLVSSVPAEASGAPQPKTWAPKSIETIPAFDSDLPTGSVAYTASAPATGSKTLAATASWVCTVYASDPWITGTIVYGDGWQSCTGSGYLQTSLKVTIQTYMGLGLWKNRASLSTSYTNYAWLERYPQYNCSGIGTYTYRIVTDGWAVYTSYHQAVQSLNYHRYSC